MNWWKNRMYTQELENRCHLKHTLGRPLYAILWLSKMQGRDLQYSRQCDRWLARFCPLFSARTRSWNEWNGLTHLQVSRTVFLASCWLAFFSPLLSPARPGREVQEGRVLSKGFLWGQSYRSPDTKHLQENRLKEEGQTTTKLWKKQESSPHLREQDHEQH